MKFVKDCDATADQFEIFRTKLVHLTSVTKEYFSNLLTALENDLCESENKGKAKIKTRTNGKKGGAGRNTKGKREKRSEGNIINKRSSRLHQDYTYP